MFKIYGPKEHPHPVKGNSSWQKGKHCPTQMQTWVFKNENNFSLQWLHQDLKPVDKG